MNIIYKSSRIRHLLENVEFKNKKIGFIPTMGALHEGHLHLVKESKKENEVTICSIFVNPIQFNNSSDLEKYPRTLEEDIRLLKSVDCDIAFIPETEDMYPAGKPQLVIDFGYQNTIMEGKFRGGHFSGVGIIVSKLFHIVQPDKAYFGQKDFQQCLVIKQLVQELSFPIEIKIIDTLREADGLAMSSRNKRLGTEERKISIKLYQSLQAAKEDFLKTGIALSKQKAMNYLSENELIKPEYFEFIETQTGMLTEDFSLGKQYAICVAAMVGDVRLIDNIVINT